ncbi:MAG: hypothetical protein ACHQT9_01080 [Candidatus Saccharimonadales bacterium]
MVLDFEPRLRETASDIEVEGYELREATIPGVARLIGGVNDRYGPESDNPLSYHNGEHGMDIIDRGVKLANILYPYMKPHHQRGIFDVIFWSGGGHDSVQGLSGDQASEIASSHLVSTEAKSTGDRYLGSKLFERRTNDAVLSTAVLWTPKGELVQPNVLRGSHDPAKLIMSNADINGIAMEGSSRMFVDVVNLCYEMNGGQADVDEVYEFLLSQAGFLKERLNDERVKTDIAYYFPETVEEIYGEMRGIFRPNILLAYATAKLLSDRSRFETPAKLAMKGLGLVDRRLLGAALGSTLHGVIMPDITPTNPDAS